MSNSIIAGVVGGLLLAAIFVYNPMSKELSQPDKIKYGIIGFLVGFFIGVIAAKMSEKSCSDREKYATEEEENEKRKECCGCEV